MRIASIGNNFLACQFFFDFPSIYYPAQHLPSKTILFNLLARVPACPEPAEGHVVAYALRSLGEAWGRDPF